MWLSLLTVRRARARRGASGAARQLVRPFQIGAVGASGAVARRHGDVHVRGLRVRHAACAGHGEPGGTIPRAMAARAARGSDLHVRSMARRYASGAEHRAQREATLHLLDTPSAIPQFAERSSGLSGESGSAIGVPVRRRGDDQYADGGPAAHPVRDGARGALPVLRLPASANTRRRWSASWSRRWCRSRTRG